MMITAIFLVGLIVVKCAIFGVVKLIHALFRRIPGGPQGWPVEHSFKYHLELSATGLAPGNLDWQSRLDANRAANTSSQCEANPGDRVTWLLLKFIAYFVRGLVPQASSNLTHFLGNTGKPLTQDVGRLLDDVGEFRSRIDNHQLELSAAAIEHWKNKVGPRRAIFDFSSAWMKFTCGEYRHLGWFLALGDWEYRLDGQVIVSPAQTVGTSICVVTTRICLRDYYDWDCGPITKIGKLSLSNWIPARLIRSGMAKEFFMYGETVLVNTSSMY